MTIIYDCMPASAGVGSRCRDGELIALEVAAAAAREPGCSGCICLGTQ